MIRERLLEKRPEWIERDIQTLRATLSMLCNYIWTKQLRDGEHMWSIPVDRGRDFDCILSDAIAELEALREASKRSEWQPIETHDGSDYVVLVAVDDGDRVIEASFCHEDNAWYELNLFDDGWPIEAVCHPTHWMPRPDPPERGVDGGRVTSPEAEHTGKP